MNYTFIYIGFGIIGLCLIVLIVFISKQNKVIAEQSKTLAEQSQTLAVQSQQFKDAQEQLEELEKQASVSSELSNNNIQNMQQTLSNSYTNLNQVLDNKLSVSFNAINQYLQSLNKDLGEMKSISSGIDEVKKVLSNVKNRGILGEIQLESILGDILAPQQYDKNVETVPGSNYRVEFAVRLPGDERPVYLPIDSKFPGESYAYLLDAYEEGNVDQIEACKKQLIQTITSEAKDISSKYIEVPYTTDFGVMFLPFEGLYAEVIQLGLLEILQNKYNVVIAGPSTMAALLSSFQMGFRTLAIQENSLKAWEVLGKVKKEFENFSKTLEDTQKHLSKASDNLDNLIGPKTKKINKALVMVESFEEGLDDFDLAGSYDDYDGE